MENIQLYNGNCLEIVKQIPDESIDLICTDPPYKITSRGDNGTSGGMFLKKSVNNGKVFENNDLEIEDWIDELYRVLKPNSHCYIMTNNKNITHYLEIIDKSQFHFIKNLIWVKDNKIMGQTYMSQFEYIIMVRKGNHRKINDCGQSDVLQIPNRKLKDEAGNSLHDTEKPTALTDILINNSTNPNDAVLDPFMGIGGCGVSAKSLGRRFIGIELNPSYYNIAESRIQTAQIIKSGASAKKKFLFELKCT